MRYKNHMKNTIVKPIDNTKLFGVSSDIEDKRSKCLDNHRVFAPNCGEVAQSNRFQLGTNVYFHHFDVIKVRENLWSIPDHSIFMSTDPEETRPVRPGVIVTKQRVIKRTGKILGSDMIVFSACWINMKEVEYGNKLIVSEYATERFYHAEEEHHFVRPENILLIIKPDGIIPGPDYLICTEKDILNSYDYKIQLFNEEKLIAKKKSVRLVYEN